MFYNLRLQALADYGACFTYRQQGHIAPNCLLKPKD
jgi:hypothetical protein